MSKNSPTYKIIPLKVIRRTEWVTFDNVPIIENLSAMDRVIHESNAVSPWPTWKVERPWYMHTKQEDNLLVLHGKRVVELYNPKTKELLEFHVCKDDITLNWEKIFNWPCLLSWPTWIFHRVRSWETWSASINFAKRLPWFDIKTNFSIYDLNIDTWKFEVIREGHLDQP